MNMKELVEKIEALSKQITEKEHELHLLRQDIEAIRTAIEANLDEETPSSDMAEEAKHEELTADPSDEAPQTEEPSQSQTPISEEQQHEAIMRTIEEFSKQSVSPKSNQGQKLRTAENTSTIGERAAGKYLADIKKAMGINERFLYANELFNGDMQAFTQAIEELNHLESALDAEALLNDQLAEKYRWDVESETVIAFKTLVSRRFIA